MRLRLRVSVAAASLDLLRFLHCCRMTQMRTLGSPVGGGKSENISSEILMLSSSSEPLLSASLLAGRAEQYDAEA